jgi:hypothetical protein
MCVPRLYSQASSGLRLVRATGCVLLAEYVLFVTLAVMQGTGVLGTVRLPW